MTGEMSLSPTSITVSRTRSTSRRPVEASRDCIPCSVVEASSTLRKRLIVCCDGTFCGADKGKQTNATNIALLCRVIANVGIDEQGKHVPQIVHYQSGVGTGSLTQINKSVQGALGHGLNEKVCEAYTFLVNNYGPGDEIFIFGFSRGAYTARCLASFICQVGLLGPGMMDYFDQIFTAYKTRDRRAGEIDFRHMRWGKQRVVPGELGYDSRWKGAPTRYEWVRTFAHLHVKIKALGVFDTVGSYGLSGWVPQPGQDVDWHATKLHPKIEYAFQALALDESRGNFPPTLFYLDQACLDAKVKLRQCWFPGYHSCIGGQCQPKYVLNSMSVITLSWMIDQLTRYSLLQINARALDYPILNRLSDDLPEISHDPAPPRSVQEAHEYRVEWSDGVLRETDTLMWEIASQIATQRWDYYRKPGEFRAIDASTGQRIDYTDFRESIHPTVWHRTRHRHYEPKCLPLDRWQRVQGDGGVGHDWVKYSKSGLEQVRIPEYVIPHIPEQKNSMAHWSGCLEQRIAPGDTLRKLDLANGVVRGSGKRPTLAKIDSGYGSARGDDFLSVEKLTVRSSSPRPSSRGSAREYYDDM